MKDKIIDILVCVAFAVSLALFAYLPILYLIFHIMQNKA